MKKSNLILVALIASVKVAEACDTAGCMAIENYGTASVRKITARTADKYQLDDGVWYNEQYIYPSTFRCGEITRGEKAMETYGTVSSGTINVIGERNGICLFAMDNVIYAKQYIAHGVESCDGLHRGGGAIETYGTASVRTTVMAAIRQDGSCLVQLDDGVFYNSSYVSPEVYSCNGGDKGGQAIERYGTASLQDISMIAQSKSGTCLFALRDKVIYNQQYISPAVYNYKNYIAGMKVLETYGTPSTRILRAVSADGYFALDDGVIYNEQYIQAIE